MKKLLFFIMVISIMVPLQSAIAETPIKRGSLIVCQPAEPPGLDPTGNTAAAIDRVVFANIFEEFLLNLVDVLSQREVRVSRLLSPQQPQAKSKREGKEGQHQEKESEIAVSGHGASADTEPDQ